MLIIIKNIKYILCTDTKRYFILCKIISHYHKYVIKILLKIIQLCLKLTFFDFKYLFITKFVLCIMYEIRI